MAINDGIELTRSTQKTEYYVVRGTIVMFKHDSTVPMFYDACPECSKKVMQNNQGAWDCNKCGKCFQTPNVRYMLNMILADSSGSTFVTVFDDAGTSLVGTNAAELKELRQKESPELEIIFQGMSHLEALFKLKSSEEVYNDEIRVRSGVIAAYPVDYVAESQKLIQKINSYL